MNSENLISLEEWIDIFLKKQNIDDEHKRDKYNHSLRTASIANQLYPNEKILEIAMKFHDIGRFVQYDRIQSFDDKILSHYILGKDFIEELEKKNIIQSSAELSIIKYIIRYHYGINYIPKNELNYIDEYTLKLIELSAIVDAIDNGCIGATYYIEREILNDEKHYKVNNPNLNMKDVSDDVLKYYLNNEKFDKFKYCKTYADYLLYAIILLIISLENNGNNREKIIEIIDKENSITKYTELMKKYINQPVSETCILHLKQMYEFYKKHK